MAMRLLTIGALCAVLLVAPVVADATGVSNSVDVSLSPEDLIAIFAIISVCLAPVVGLLTMLVDKHYGWWGALMLLVLILAIVWLGMAAGDIISEFTTVTGVKMPTMLN